MICLESNEYHNLSQGEIEGGTIGYSYSGPRKEDNTPIPFKCSKCKNDTFRTSEHPKYTIIYLECLKCGHLDTVEI